MTKTVLVPAIIASLFSVSLCAQQSVPPCKANDLAGLEMFHHNDPVELARMQAADAELEGFTHAWLANNSGAERVDYVIPVVFHIIHNNGVENISDEQVYDAMEVLNNDFNRLNADWQNVREEFVGIVANVGITFRLARKDPQGNCTKGITRTMSPLTNDGTQTMKNLIQWPRNRYLNVWVAASADGAAGYTYRPGSVSNWAAADGIVLLHNYTGRIGTGSAGRSRTLTHEVGHWINLAHTWGNSNNPGLPENCNDDDNVSDTPNTIGWTSCVTYGEACGSLSNVENYMEYAYCSKMFTEGQKARMIASLNSGTAQRNQLITTTNLALTGVAEDPVLCAAEFSSNSTLVCAGSVITFIDESFHGVISRSWSFPGGTPSTSEEATATVTYDQPGNYPVVLTVSDGITTLSSTQNTSITVLPNPGQVVPFSEGFESITNLNGPEWFVQNPNNDNTFGVTNSVGYTGTSCVRLLNNAAMDGNVDELVSRTYDMTDAEAISISFRYAYAKRNSSSDDVLTVLISNDCGATWLIRKILRGTNTLNTAGVVPSNFIPNASQWGYAEVTNISASGSAIPNFRFKFHFTSDGGNNLYLDDININGMPVGFAEHASKVSGAMVVPNPASDAAQLFFTLPVASRVRIELMDALGRTVWMDQHGTLPSGDHRIQLGIGTMARGTYSARIIAENDTRVVRFVID